MGETGEIAEKFKNIRDQNAPTYPNWTNKISRHPAQTCWVTFSVVFSCLADHLQHPFCNPDIADKNDAKLASRQQRGTLSG